MIYLYGYYACHTVRVTHLVTVTLHVYLLLRCLRLLLPPRSACGYLRLRSFAVLGSRIVALRLVTRFSFAVGYTRGCYGLPLGCGLHTLHPRLLFAAGLLPTVATTVTHTFAFVYRSRFVYCLVPGYRPVTHTHLVAVITQFCSCSSYPAHRVPFCQFTHLLPPCLRFWITGLPTRAVAGCTTFSCRLLRIAVYHHHAPLPVLFTTLLRLVVTVLPTPAVRYIPVTHWFVWFHLLRSLLLRLRLRWFTVTHYTTRLPVTATLRCVLPHAFPLRLRFYRSFLRLFAVTFAFCARFTPAVPRLRCRCPVCLPFTTLQRLHHCGLRLYTRLPVAARSVTVCYTVTTFTYCRTVPVAVTALRLRYVRWLRRCVYRLPAVRHHRLVLVTLPVLLRLVGYGLRVRFVRVYGYLGCTRFHGLRLPVPAVIHFVPLPLPFTVTFTVPHTVVYPTVAVRWLFDCRATCGYTLRCWLPFRYLTLRFYMPRLPFTRLRVVRATRCCGYPDGYYVLLLPFPVTVYLVLPPVYRCSRSRGFTLRCYTRLRSTRALPPHHAGFCSWFCVYVYVVLPVTFTLYAHTGLRCWFICYLPPVGSFLWFCRAFHCAHVYVVYTFCRGYTVAPHHVLRYGCCLWLDFLHTPGYLPTHGYVACPHTPHTFCRYGWLHAVYLFLPLHSLHRHTCHVLPRGSRFVPDTHGSFTAVMPCYGFTRLGLPLRCGCTLLQFPVWFTPHTVPVTVARSFARICLVYVYGYTRTFYTPAVPYLRQLPGYTPPHTVRLYRTVAGCSVALPRDYLLPRLHVTTRTLRLQFPALYRLPHRAILPFYSLHCTVMVGYAVVGYGCRLHVYVTGSRTFTVLRFGSAVLRFAGYHACTLRLVTGCSRLFCALVRTRWIVALPHGLLRLPGSFGSVPLPAVPGCAVTLGYRTRTFVRTWLVCVTLPATHRLWFPARSTPAVTALYIPGCCCYLTHTLDLHTPLLHGSHCATVAGPHTYVLRIAHTAVYGLHTFAVYAWILVVVYTVPVRTHIPCPYTPFIRFAPSAFGSAVVVVRVPVYPRTFGLPCYYICATPGYGLRYVYRLHTRTTHAVGLHALHTYTRFDHRLQFCYAVAHTRAWTRGYVRTTRLRFTVTVPHTPFTQHHYGSRRYTRSYCRSAGFCGLRTATPVLVAVAVHTHLQLPAVLRLYLYWLGYWFARLPFTHTPYTVTGLHTRTVTHLPFYRLLRLPLVCCLRLPAFGCGLPQLVCLPAVLPRFCDVATTVTPPSFDTRLPPVTVLPFGYALPHRCYAFWLHHSPFYHTPVSFAHHYALFLLPATTV